MIKQIAHLCIHTEDLDKTLSFYSDALGMSHFFDFDRQGERFGYYLKAGANTFIEVFKGDPSPVGNINHLALEVEDMDAVIARLKEHGVTTTEKVLGADNSWQAWLEDPNGVRIELHEYTQDSNQLRGGTCKVDW